MHDLDGADSIAVLLVKHQDADVSHDEQAIVRQLLLLLNRLQRRAQGHATGHDRFALLLNLKVRVRRSL